MRRLIPVVFVALAVCLTPSRSWGLLFTDDFSTNPFGTTSPPEARRWCERFHHVHWDGPPSGGTFGRLLAADGTCCTGAVNCSGGCDDFVTVGGSCGQPIGQTSVTCNAPMSDSEATNCRHLLISDIDYPGDERDATVAFSLPTEFGEGCLAGCAGCQLESVRVAAAAHPHCEATIEARVIKESTGYRLQIASITNAMTGFPECSALSEVESSASTVPLSLGTLTTGGSRYELSISVTRHETLSSTKLKAIAELYDRELGVVVSDLVAPTLTRPAWYNDEGQRFAIGGVFRFRYTDDLLILDDFRGETSFVPPSPTDPLYANAAPAVLNTAVATTVKDSTSFLYAPVDPNQPTLQTDFDDPNGFIDPDKIELTRAAVIHGTVRDEGGEPLGGVSITIR